MKRKTAAAFCAVLLLASAVFAGCGRADGTEDRGQTVQTQTALEASGISGTPAGQTTEEASVIVTMPVTSEPEAGFDPVYGWGAGEHVHEPLIQSTLTTTTTDLQIGLDLAVDYSVSEDGLLWTVVIRDDVYFTDGEKLTASDVAFTYNLCAANSSVNDFTMLERAEAVDDVTVEFHMNRPFSIWPYTMAVVGIVPEHAYDENYGSEPIGSGRYILRQWDRGQQVILEANPDYYGGEVKMKRVTVLFMEEDAALAAAMAGQVDVAHTAASYADQLVEGYGLLRVESVDNRGINLPAVSSHEEDGVTVGNNVTSDIAIRRAVNIGIDREEMIENVLNGYGTPAYSVCDKLPWYNEDSRVEYDFQEAVRILEEAGWVEGSDGIREKNGVRAAFTVMYQPDDSVRQALAADLANQCARLGIEVELQGAGWDVAYTNALSQPLMWGWGAHTPMELYNIYHTAPGSGSAQYSPYSNETVDAYMDQALAADSLEEAYGLWQKAQWDGSTGVTQQGDIPWVWLCNVDHLYYVRDGLQIAEQKIHPHGHGWSLVNNVDQWEWKS
ncbi:MAG TPA: ABC transporter substrate-binding protein [Candidatus Eisenbergiella merdipullorum]|uniref:ABC transporter substrate-binding protein n=1 Tax=Candidatus Eisenbergiella merdipullorum TaxID=2838553 RepID=A0A9D2I8Y4_9FIRM|nr:ABC transporter substrate-binding protein [Candidatus Eisenbergiella merdipullorum]